MKILISEPPIHLLCFSGHKAILLKYKREAFPVIVTDHQDLVRYIDYLVFMLYVYFRSGKSGNLLTDALINLCT